MFKHKVLLFLACMMFSGVVPIHTEDIVPAKGQESQVVVYYLTNTFRCLACQTVEGIARDAIMGTPEEPGPFAT